MTLWGHFSEPVLQKISECLKALEIVSSESIFVDNIILQVGFKVGWSLMLRGRLMPFLKLSLSQVVFTTEFIISNKGPIMWVHHLEYRIPLLQFILVIGKGQLISERNLEFSNLSKSQPNFRQISALWS